MNPRVIRYNPAFLSEDELIKSFVIRHKELDSIIRVVEENTRESNQHLLIIGARGLGKTSLVLRVAVEVRNNENLCDKWYPLVFAEESYQVGTPGEFWLEAIFHLAQQTKDNRWEETFEELKKESSEVNLRERALARLLDFADEQGKRILLIVENFNMLLGDQITDEDAWVLRQTLQNEQRIMLLATATSRFKKIDNADKAMFELFKLYELHQLSNEECLSLWKALTGEQLPIERILPVKILTGGNPRLLTIVASFGAKLSFRELMDELIQLVDGHTEYFKNHLDNLPSVERKVYVALLEIWRPATANEVSKAARLNINKTSAYLERLANCGAVVVVDEQSRKKWYQVAERMYNIYYLMRRRGGVSGQIKALVNFMVDFYKSEDLINITKHIAEEACKLPLNDREEYYRVYEAIQNSTDDKVCGKIVDSTPYEFFTDAPDSLKSLKQAEANIKGIASETKKLCKRVDELNKKPGQQKEKERILRKILELEPKHHWAWVQLGELLENLKRYEEAEQAYRKAIELKPDKPFVWAQLGQLLHKNLKHYEEAEQAYRKVVELKPNNHWAWEHLGELSHKALRRYKEAEQAYRKAIETEPSCPVALANLASLLLIELNRPCDALRLKEDCLMKNSENPSFLDAFAWAFCEYGKLDFLILAETLARKAITLKPDDAKIRHTLASILCSLGKGIEALISAKKYLEDTKVVMESVDFAINLFVEFTARGYGKQALNVLRNSPSVSILEPLVVGLQLFVGEDVKAPTEIMEVAQDVVEKIKIRSKQLKI